MKMYAIFLAKYRWNVTSAIVALPFLLLMSGAAMSLEKTEADYELKLLGKYLFFDKLSLPSRQSCSTCHTPDAGWTNGTSGINQHQVAVTGANPHAVGALKPPTNAYASFIPDFDINNSPPSGGNFWNGRAKGDAVRELDVLLGGNPSLGGLARYALYLGPTADQALASPFINPVEQGLPHITAVCELVQSAKYAPLYAIAYDGAQIDCASDVVETTFGRFALALAAYQHSDEVNAFDSKRDRALANDRDGVFPLDDFTDQENLGHDLFYGFGRGEARCAGCHRSGTVLRDGTDPQERYTNDEYNNIGTPRNTEIPGNPLPNIGLAATTGNETDEGLQKVPTLRNVDKRRGEGFKKAYTHNGWFKSLESIVHFYNTSNISGDTATEFGVTRCPESVVMEKDALAQNCWPEPEFDNRISGFFVGNLRMTANEEAALVAYLKTFTDIPTAKAPKPFNLKKFEKGQLR